MLWSNMLCFEFEIHNKPGVCGDIKTQHKCVTGFFISFLSMEAVHFSTVLITVRGNSSKSPRGVLKMYMMYTTSLHYI